MKLLLMLCALALTSFAQGTLGLACPSARRGSTVNCSLVLAGGSLPAGLEFAFTSSIAVGAVTVVPGAQAVAASKGVACSPSILCLITGINTNTIADGSVALLAIPIPLTAPLGNATFSLTSTLGATAAAVLITESANPPLSVAVLPSPCDVNGDGQLTAVDFTQAIQNVFAVPQVAMDLNKDGKTDLLDVLIVINAVLVNGCAAQ